MEPTGKEVSIFIVDDDEDDQFFMQYCLKSHFPAYTFDSFSNGVLFLNELEKERSLPNLVLLDLNMPMMGGFEVLGQVRLNPKYKDLPIIILTTSSQDIDRQKAQALKANKFITKPGKVTEICKVLMDICHEFI